MIAKGGDIPSANTPTGTATRVGTIPSVGVPAGAAAAVTNSQSWDALKKEVSQAATAFASVNKVISSISFASDSSLVGVVANSVSAASSRLSADPANAALLGNALANTSSFVSQAISGNSFLQNILNTGPGNSGPGGGSPSR